MTPTYRPVKLWLYVFAPLCAMFVLTSTWTETQLSPDPVAAAMSAWSIAEDGDLTLSAAERRNAWVYEVDGRLVSNRQPGVIAAGVPFYLLARPFTDAFSLLPMALAAAVITAAAAATLAVLIVRIGAPPRAAASFAVLGSLATATWSVSADALWTHGPDQLLLVICLLCLSHQRYALAGLSMGAAITVRTHLAVVALTLGIAALAHARRLKPLIVIGAWSSLGLAMVLLYTAVVFGAWSPNAGYTANGGYPTAQLAQSSAATTIENLLGSLINPNRGVLLTTPILLALLPGAIRCWRGAAWWVQGAAVGGLAYTLVQCRINGFSGGTYFWGSRLTLELLTLCAPLLWLSWQATSRKSTDVRAGLHSLTVFSIAIHAAGQFVERPVVADSWTTWFVREEAFGLEHSPWVRGIMSMAVLLAVGIMLRNRHSRQDLPPTGAPRDVASESELPAQRARASAPNVAHRM